MPRSYKVTVIGDQSVGKTCLSRRFCEGEFPAYEPPATIIVEFYRKNVDIGNWRCTLQFWDTAGLEQNRKSMVPQYYRNSEAVVFVYDVTRIETFNSLPHWMDECNTHIGQDLKNVTRVLVAMKADVPSAERADLGRKFAKLHNMLFFAVSAKKSPQSEIDAIFTAVAQKLKDREPKYCPPINTETFKISAKDKPVYDKSNNECCC